MLQVCEAGDHVLHFRIVEQHGIETFGLDIVRIVDADTIVQIGSGRQETKSMTFPNFNTKSPSSKLSATWQERKGLRDCGS